MATFMGRHCEGGGQDRGAAQGGARWHTKWGTGNMGGSKVKRHCATSQVLQLGLAFSLLLCAHAGYHIECNLCVLNLLELEGTWVRQKVDKGSSAWKVQDFIDPHYTPD